MTIKNIFSDKPHNPMVNSGAIMSASILLHLVRPEMKIPLKYDYVMEFFKSLAGGEHVGFSNSVKTYYLKFTKTNIIGFVIRDLGLLQSELLHTTSRVWVNYLSSVFGEFWLVSDNKRDKKLCTSCLKIMA